MGGTSPASSTADAPHRPILNRPIGEGVSLKGAPRRSVPSGIRRVWHGAQFASPSATPFDVGIHRRSGSVPSASRFYGRVLESLRPAGERNDLGIEDAKCCNVELVEYALPGPHPIGLGSQSGRLDQRLGPDRLQHLPVACRLASRVINGVRTKVIDGRLVVLLGEKNAPAARSARQLALPIRAGPLRPR